MNNSYPNTSTVAKAYFYGNVVSAGDRYIDDFLHPRVVDLTTAKRSVFLPSIDIARVPFMVSEKEGSFVLSNPQWPSLTSFGSSLSEAIENAVELIYTVSMQYILEPDDSLSVDGVEFKKFLLSRIFR